MRLITTLFAFLLFSTSALAQDEVPALALVGGHVVDVHTGDIQRDAVVLVQGERISAIGVRGDVTIPADATRVDLSGRWLVPGLMNMHVHPGLILPGKLAAELANESDAALALRMSHALRRMLEIGVTTVRIPGDSRHVDLALARSIYRGETPGPRIHSAGEPVVITGGHRSKRGVAHADGPDELVKAARLQISAGARWIKILISGGIATEGGEIAEALMTPEEIRAVVDASHRFGVPVAAHSGSPAATRVAVQAGVDSIEHGYALDRAVLREMREAGTWFVPTIVVSQSATTAYFERIGSPPWYMLRRESVGRQHWEALRIAIDEGVNIALGTDGLPYESADDTTWMAREIEYYVEAGMTPLAALQSATLNTARMLGTEESLGSLEAGKLADILALPANPLEDIRALREVDFVMKGGEVYRRDGESLLP
jgi:imidazolonepropionase-like amidohydrolase